MLHPKPYPLVWVCDNVQLQVAKQCRLRFAITSGFVDEVDLDVVMLDICGIVLGSPYLYDRKVIVTEKIEGISSLKMVLNISFVHIT